MRIVLGSDHAGFDLKEDLLSFVKGLGHTAIDAGAYNAEPSDYPDSSEAVGLALVEGRADRGILICGSGVGASVACNKIPGIRAGICHDMYSAHQGVEHDNMNVIVLGSRIVGTFLARDLVKTFLDARFSGEERHARRLNKVLALERRYMEGEAAPGKAVSEQKS